MDHDHDNIFMQNSYISLKRIILSNHEEIFSSANPLDARILNENSKLNISTLFSIIQIHKVKDSYKDSRFVTSIFSTADLTLPGLQLHLLSLGWEPPFPPPLQELRQDTLAKDSLMILMHNDGSINQKHTNRLSIVASGSPTNS